MSKELILVTGAAASSAAISSPTCCARATGRSAPSTSSRSRSGSSASPRWRTCSSTCTSAEACERPCKGATEVYNLAADMGGMGFIENNKALCMLSVLINTHLLHGRPRDRASSATSTPPRPASTTPTSSATPTSCRSRKRTPIRPCPRTATAGRSSSASACAAISARTSASCTRVARFHNVYGPHGTWDGGREKAPAAICRKVIAGQADRPATRSKSGATATRPAASCTSTTASRASQPILHSDIHEPINLGIERTGHHQRAGRHRRGHRRHQAEAQLQPRRPQGRQRPQQRQHADPGSCWAGSRAPACATEWKRPTPGSTTRSLPASRAWWREGSAPERARMTADRPPRIAVLYQFFHPDDVVSARHLTQFCEDLQARGWQVEALPCNRGCRDHSVTYPAARALARHRPSVASGGRAAPVVRPRPHPERPVDAGRLVACWPCGGPGPPRT